MKHEIMNLKRERSLYDIALDIGISEASLYCYLNNYRKIGDKVLIKIREYLEGRRDESKLGK